MLVAVCSGRGSPGSTTTALGLAAAWPSNAVVVEADPSGGDLGLRIRRRGLPLPESPTVLSLVAASRKDTRDKDLVARYAAPLSVRVGVVPAHRYAELAESLSGYWEPLAWAMGRSSTDVIADVGRIHAAAIAMPVLQIADAILVVGRPDFVGANHLVERTRQLSLALSRAEAEGQLWPVLVGPARHEDGHVEDLQQLLAKARVGVAGVGYVAHDPAAVARLEAGEDPAGRSLSRTALLRTAGALATDLTTDPQRSRQGSATAPVEGVSRR